MIGYNSLKLWLLKALNLSKQYSRRGLVLVQRTANGPTGPYLVHKWVRPDQVSTTTDHVLAGHHNLQQGHPQRPAKVRSLASTSPLPNSVKQLTENLFQQCNQNVALFYQVLQHNLGLHWTRDPVRPGLDLMRAKMALNNAQANGLDLVNFPQHLLGLNNPVTNPSSSSQTSVQAAQPAPAATPVSSTPPTTAPAAALQPANQPSLSNSITLPPKAVKASTAAKQSASDFAKSFFNRQDFYDAITQMGIKWKVNTHPGINNMWAISALAQHIENGFDVNAAWAAIQNGTNITSSTTTPVPTATPVQPIAPPPPPVDPTLVEIPKDATPEQKAIAELINKMTDIDEINKCFVLRAVPEDDTAKDYMFNTSLLKLKKWMATVTKFELRDTVQQFHKNLEEIGETFNSKLCGDGKSGGTTTTGSSSIYNEPDVAKTVLKTIPITGCSRNILANGINKGFTGLNMDVFTNPQNYIRLSHEGHKPGTVSPQYLLRNLGGAFAGYATDVPSYGTNRGYEGYNSEVYDKRYDLNKEGFVRLLQKIKQDNANDSAVGAEVDSMIKDYDKLMSLVQHNPNLLEEVLGDNNWYVNYRPFSAYDVGYGYSSFSRAKVLMEGVNAQTNVMINTLLNKGYNVDDIVESLKSYSNNDLKNYSITNSQTGQIDTIDLTQEVDPDSGLTLSMMGATETSRLIKTYVLTKLQERMGLTDAQTTNWYTSESFKNSSVRTIERLKNKSSIDLDAYKQIHTLSSKIFGINMDMSQTYDVSQAVTTKSTNSAKNVILSNLLMTSAFTEAASNVAFYAYKNGKSKFNNQGTDYSGNFDYFDGSHKYNGMNSPNSSILRQYESTATYTPQELDAKIIQQLNSIPTYSSDYVNNLSRLSGQNLARNSIIRMESATNLDALMDDPKKDVIYKTTVAMLSLVPNTVLKNPNLAQKVAQKWDYVPYDFSTTAQPRLSRSNQQPQQQQPVPQTTNPLKEARERLFKVATCSIATEPPHISNQMQQECRTTKLDYKPGEKDPDGTVYNKKLHPNFVVLFNSPIFAIKNSVFKPRFDKMKAKLKATCSDPECYNSLEVSHGCSRAAAANILERDGAFYVDNQYNKVAAALGPGMYCSNKVGKNFAYVGDSGYSFNNTPGAPGAADGCVIFAEVMRGKNYTKNGSSDKSYTSSSAGKNRGWYEFELCVRDNALINPHHFVDMSCAELGVSIWQDTQGNYTDRAGNILYDKDGKNVNVKW